MGIIDNELLDQLCECVQRNWPGRGIIPGHKPCIVLAIIGLLMGCSSVTLGSGEKKTQCPS